MSGHSKWSTIKHKKEATDAKRGKLFSQLSKAITIAVKTGGGNDPSSNHKLRMTIDQAKTANMPKSNIERAIANAERAGDLIEATYEGFGPAGINVMVKVATTNKNRTASEIKGIFDKSGGKLGQSGSVGFNFETKGVVLVKQEKDVDSQLLNLIDLGAEDVESSASGVEVYVVQENLTSIRNELESSGQEIISYDITKKPKTYVSVEDQDTADKIVIFLEKLENLEDVQKVYANVEFNLGNGEKES